MQSAFGLDFGYTNDPSALFCGLVAVSYTHLDVYKRQIVYRAILKDLWAHIAHEDLYLGAACMAGGYCVVQLLVFTITGNWIGG